MKIAALVEALVAAGATPEIILAAVRTTESANEAALDQSREKTRLRVAKWRETKAGNVTDGRVTTGNTLTSGDARGEDKPLTQKIEPQESKKTTDALRDVEEFKAVLSPFLSDVQVTGLLKIRRKKRAVISGHAATLLLKAIARTNLSIPDAADKCIERNWISIEAEWLPQARGSPPSIKAPSQSDVFRLIAERAANGQDGDDRGRIRPALSDLRTG